MPNIDTDNDNKSTDLTAIEFDIEWNESAWWAACPVKGTLAIGSGQTVWDAIAAAIADIPRTEEWCRRMDAAVAKAKAGTFRCPGCQALRPAMTPETLPWAFYCDACRGELP